MLKTSFSNKFYVECFVKISGGRSLFIIPIGVSRIEQYFVDNFRSLSVEKFLDRKILKKISIKGLYVRYVKNF